MAVSSKLKTIDGKYYATEEYVDQVAQGVKDNIMDEVETEIQQTVELNVEEKISGMVYTKDEVYTKEQVQDIINNFYSFNTL